MATAIETLNDNNLYDPKPKDAEIAEFLRYPISSTMDTATETLNDPKPKYVKSVKLPSCLISSSPIAIEILNDPKPKDAEIAEFLTYPKPKSVKFCLLPTYPIYSSMATETPYEGRGTQLKDIPNETKPHDNLHATTEFATIAEKEQKCKKRAGEASSETPEKKKTQTTQSGTKREDDKTEFSDSKDESQEISREDIEIIVAMMVSDHDNDYTLDMVLGKLWRHSGLDLRHRWAEVQEIMNDVRQHSLRWDRLRRLGLRWGLC